MKVRSPLATTALIGSIAALGCSLGYSDAFRDSFLEGSAFSRDVRSPRGVPEAFGAAFAADGAAPGPSAVTDGDTPEGDPPAGASGVPTGRAGSEEGAWDDRSVPVVRMSEQWSDSNGASDAGVPGVEVDGLSFYWACYSGFWNPCYPGDVPYEYHWDWAIPEVNCFDRRDGGPNVALCGTPVCTAHSHCDDGLFCNGTERCRGGIRCESSGNPCAAGFRCDEAANICVPPDPGPPECTPGDVGFCCHQRCGRNCCEPDIKICQSDGRWGTCGGN